MKTACLRVDLIASNPTSSSAQGRHDLLLWDLPNPGPLESSSNPLRELFKPATCVLPMHWMVCRMLKKSASLRHFRIVNSRARGAF